MHFRDAIIFAEHFLGMDMKPRAFGLRWLVAISVVVLTGFAVNQAIAQSQCDYAACPANTTYHDGGCYDSPQFLTNVQSHTLAVCNTGDTLNRDTGNCHKPNCFGGIGAICQTKPLCPSGTTYTGSGTSPTGTYGVCQMGPNGPGGAIDHQLVYCDAGWALNTTAGTCRHCPLLGGGLVPLHLQLPDLVIRRVWLEDARTGAPVPTVQKAHPFLACFTVANTGAGASGTFRIGAGGVGIPGSPFQDHAGLAVGATRDGCVTFATTPSLGKYRLAVTADSLHAIAESNETNNDAWLIVNVTP